MIAPRLPLDPAVELGTCDAGPRLEQRWGAPAGRRDEDGWSRLVWKQSWFGLAELDVTYTFAPDGGLTRIDFSAPDAEAVARAMQHELGAADEAGPSPQFLNSLRYWWWHRDGVLYALEDFAPGAEIGIVRHQAT